MHGVPFIHESGEDGTPIAWLGGRLVAGGPPTTDSSRRVDVVVIGAGIIGASCAFHLAERGLSVLVLEALQAPAEGSTGRSFASVRGQWADPLNVEISWRSIQTYRDFERLHGCDVGYRPTGYLFLVPQDRWQTHRASVKMQREHGVPVSELTPEAAQRHTPFETEGIAGATWGEADGVVDPQGVTMAYLGLARGLGAEVAVMQAVTSVVARPDGGWRVGTSDLEVEATTVVNAAGGWSREVAALAGIDVPVDHVRRSIFSTASSTDPKRYPMTIDMGSGAFLRSEGDRLLFGMARQDEPLGFVNTLDWDWVETVLETACRRFPWLADLPLDRSASWAGTYEVTADDLPVLGANPAATGWLDACGFSGHGVMQAPEIGRLVTEEVVDGRVHSLDIGPLRHGRFAQDAADQDARETTGRRTEMIY